MRVWRDISIRTKILVAFSTMFVALVALGDLAMTGMAEMAEQSATIRKDWMPAWMEFGRLRKAVIAYRLAETDALLATASGAAGGKDDDAMAAAAAEVEKAYDEYRTSIVAGDESAKILAGFDKKWPAFRQAARETAASARAGRLADAVKAYAEPDSAASAAIVGLLDQGIGLNQKGAYEAARKVEETYRRQAMAAGAERRRRHRSRRDDQRRPRLRHGRAAAGRHAGRRQARARRSRRRGEGRRSGRRNRRPGSRARNLQGQYAPRPRTRSRRERRPRRAGEPEARHGRANGGPVRRQGPLDPDRGSAGVGRFPPVGENPERRRDRDRRPGQGGRARFRGFVEQYFLRRLGDRAIDLFGQGNRRPGPRIAADRQAIPPIRPKAPTGRCAISPPPPTASAASST